VAILLTEVEPIGVSTNPELDPVLIFSPTDHHHRMVDEIPAEVVIFQRLPT
jgi:hypothetical protein